MSEKRERYRLPQLPAEAKCVALPVGKDERGLPIDALVVRKDGVLHAYTNVCKHIPIPLDSGSGDYLDEHEGETYLICNTHGALYRLNDGMCVLGPCSGEALDRLDLEEHDGTWFVVTK
ncbi:MAG: Rieske 2Fe-2S domain-containing protein [Myxococcota bacterium]